MSTQDEPRIQDVTALLARFFSDRTGRTREQLEAEYGELLLYFMRLANRSGVDLIDLGQRYIDSTARTQAPVRTGDS